MGRPNPRNYKCRDEELPMLCAFAAHNLRCDLTDFTVFSPGFNQEYVTGFEARIATVMQTISPKSDLLDQKIITRRLFLTLDELIPAIDRLTGYITLSKLNQHISLSDFGITYLRKSIISRDCEGAMKSLRTIKENIGNNKALLTAEGLTDELVARFTEAAVSLANDKQKQYEMIVNRRLRVQNNLALFNGLYQQLCEILFVGKILYKGHHPLKLQEYTFTWLKTNVRRTGK